MASGKQNCGFSCGSSEPVRLDFAASIGVALQVFVSVDQLELEQVLQRTANPSGLLCPVLVEDVDERRARLTGVRLGIEPGWAAL